MITLTKKEFNNLNILHAEIEKKYPQFLGFNGSRDNMQVFGITDEEALKELENIDINSLLPKPKTEKEKILDALNLTEADLAKLKNLP